ncbi:MAG: AAA family ATPase [Alphaproteobacteria bacterium]|nr:AAA family ATPase [Alphaproteobacteria bacterium]
MLGFKSFVSETELLIAPGLTGIVGPNGCGKSNLVEALRWVMGENSARSLRGGEMDEVIFGGTVGRPARNVAEVRLTLDNQKRDAPTPPNIASLNDSDEIEISRQITRHHGSLYRINGKESRARDVQLFFADAGSGAHSPALVSQGRVAALIASRREERRALLEDAAGIGGLYARRSEAESRLAATSANLLRVDDVVKTLGVRRDALARQVEQARHYRALSAEIRETEAEIYRLQWQIGHQALQDAVAHLTACRARLSALEGELAQATENLTHLSREVDQGRQNYDQTSENWQKLRLDLSSAENEQKRQQDALAATQAQSQQLEREWAREKALASEAEREVQSFTNALGEMTAQINDGPAQAQKFQQELERRRQQFTLAQARKDALNREISLLNSQKNDRERAAKVHNDRQAQFLQEKSRLDRELAQLEQEISAQSATDDGADGHAAKHQPKTLAELELELAQWQSQRQEFESQIAALRVKLQEDAKKLADAEGARARLQGEQEGLRHILAALQAESEAQHRDATEAQEDQAHILAELPEILLDLEAPDAQTTEIADDNLPDFWAEILARIPEDAVASELFKTAPDYAKAIMAVLGDAVAAKLWQLDADEDLAQSLAPNLPVFYELPEFSSIPPFGSDFGALTPLAKIVTPPKSLARLFAQVFLVEQLDTAWKLWPDLAPGQILVSRDGNLWRWDGYYQPADAQILAAEQAAAEAKAIAARHASLRAAKIAAHQAALAERQVKLREQQEKLAAERKAQFEKRQQERQQIHAERAAQLAHLTDEIARAIQACESFQSAWQLSHENLEKLGAEHRTLAEQEQEIRKNIPQTRQAEAAHQQRQATLQAKRAMLSDQQSRWQKDYAQFTAADAAQKLLPESDYAAELNTAQQNLSQNMAEFSAAQMAYDAVRSQVEKHKQAEALRGERLAALSRDHMAWQGRAATAQQRLAEMTAQRDAVHLRLTELTSAPDYWQNRQADVQKQLSEAQIRRDAVQNSLRQAEQNLAAKQHQHHHLEQNQANARESLVRAEILQENAETQQKNLIEQIAEKWQQTPVQFLARWSERDISVKNRPDESTDMRDGQDDGENTQESANETVKKLKSRLERKMRAREALGEINLRAESDEAALEQEINELTREKNDLTLAIAKLTAAIDEINRDGRQRLLAAFIEVDRHFRGLFEGLFGGGRAELKLSNHEDPLQAGLEIFACPPGKNLQNLSLLSGGEQALTCLALIFAVFLTHPAPICVLDEVDAPLDDANVDRFCQVLRKITALTQTRFLVVTHHRLTMAKMDRLYGVTMPERGVSQIVSVDLSQARVVGAR